MILTMINWGYATLIAGILGIGFLTAFKKITGYECKEGDVCIFLGIALTTAYAETFSLFYKVSGVANAVLLVICIIISILCRKWIVCLMKDIKKKIVLIGKVRVSKGNIVQILMVATVFIFFWLLGCQRALHADTDLYHAQSIRWVEEYGVVKGLGNLHHRLAFNSAFMVYQALFSWAFLIEQSMHVMNAYLCMLVVVYALFTCSIFKGERVKGTDSFRLVMLIYLVMNIESISSPGTDTFVSLFFIYILLKWCEYVEEEKASEAYGLLCLLVLLAITVKISVAMIILLALKPAIELLKEKRWKTIGFLILSGLFIVVPYCVRNVVISGYLLYPSVLTGFFDFDWKMLPYALEFDSQEIMSRARGVYGIENYARGAGMAFTEWFPVWWETQSLWVQLMVFVNILLLPICAGINVKKIKQKCKTYDVFINVMVIVQLIYWMLSAPRSRYGGVFLFLIPCITFVQLLNENRRNAIILCKWGGLISLSFLFVCFIYKAGTQIESIPLKRSAYYVYRECNEVEWEGVTLYTPVESTYTGYYYFPGIPYERRLQYLELRGDSIKDGIRVKEEYKDIQLSTYGTIIE